MPRSSASTLLSIRAWCLHLTHAGCPPPIHPLPSSICSNQAASASTRTPPPLRPHGRTDSRAATLGRALQLHAASSPPVPNHSVFGRALPPNPPHPSSSPKLTASVKLQALRVSGLLTEIAAFRPLSSTIFAPQICDVFPACPATTS